MIVSNLSHSALGVNSIKLSAIKKMAWALQLRADHGLTDLSDSDMEESAPFIDENSILSSASDVTNTSPTAQAQVTPSKERQKETTRHNTSKPNQKRRRLHLHPPKLLEPSERLLYCLCGLHLLGGPWRPSQVEQEVVASRKPEGLL